MAVQLTIPDGSIIEEVETIDGPTYRWKQPSGGPLRYVFIAFLSLWLCGWIFGFAAAIGIVLRGNPQTFLLVWLAGWTLGGIMATCFLYRLLRPQIPERITLGCESVYYDSGTASPMLIFNPWSAMRYSSPHEILGRAFQRRRRIVRKSDFGKTVLERIGERQRLYFDYGADRVEIGEHLREPEREWLAKVIQAWEAAS